jgi:hypothetical protein
MKWLPKTRWSKLRDAFVFGHSLGAISQATGIPKGTLSAFAARHNWSRNRAPGTVILRRQKNMNEAQQQKPRAGVTGKGFVKGDKRINRRGRPRSFDELRKLALQIAAENVIDAAGNNITRAEQLLRSWAKSRVPALQLAFAAYCWGKPPEKLEVNKLEPRTRLILHYGNELPAREASASALRLRLSAPGDGNSESPRH